MAEQGKEKRQLAVALPPEGDADGYERETWSNKLDFLLACIGFSVGLGNVWRFPYLCYKNGGGAFLLPYFLCVFIGGIPVFFMEVSLGQFMGRGGLKTWNIVPLFKGIGITVCIIVFLLNCYYNVILCWAFYYMFNSFQAELPWRYCGHEWNTIWCNDDFGSNVTLNDTLAKNNLTFNPMEVYKFSDPVTEFWELKTLAISDGIDEVGTIKWDLALCLLFAWIVVYLCICKGIKSSGKVMYVTATSPYIFMLILLIRNSLLDGAYDGVIFYLKPDLERLKDTRVWVDAGTQIFFSYSLSLGTLNALGSYNKFNHNSYRDAILFSLANSGTSFFAGFIVFTILGYMAKIQGVPISEVAESGPGLAFIAYPKAVSQMPVAPLWSILFFLMVILLGLDSQFVGVEGVVTAVVDQYPDFLRKGYRKEMFIGFICVLNFFVGLSMVTNGGMYVFQLFDYYSGSRIILLVAFFELIAVAYCYGVNRLYDNIEMMLGRRIWPYMKICWLFFSPLFCIVIFILSAINYSELEYERPRNTYVYPDWAVGIGWAMACASVIFIPLTAFYTFIKYGFTMEVLRLSIRPYGLKDHQKRIQDINERTLEDLEKENNRGVQYDNGQVNLGFEKTKGTYPEPHFTQL
ncbi:sodium- and chloride-dependent taurine transporter isoform X1 [Patella vulgata]|uniref:sodium- and chloride-dependent taurine transporter isoform X1 n=2 Tax=Patella vulgata TaxID=6465 RepID=UPI0024A7F9EF|nr:sodium- and chloride-dependent taurine transporter isoform X1 [Patella vulgata]